MCLLYAAGSAFFAGITSILAKCGIRKADSTAATAIRTFVILIFSWLIAGAAGSLNQIGSISGRTLLFLVLSGAATGASWLCYFRALQLGDINKVVPVDKSSTVLTIILALIFLGEGVSFQKALAVVAIAAGILLMIEKKDVSETKSGGRSSWLLYAAGSAFFRKSDSDFRKNRHIRCGIKSGHSNPHCRCVGYGMADGFYYRQTKRSKKNQRQGTCFYMPFGYCHGSVVAVLLPGASGGACQCGGACG